MTPAEVDRLMAAAETIREATGIPLAPHWLEPHQRSWATVTEALGERAGIVRTVGTASLDELAEEALCRFPGARESSS